MLIIARYNEDISWSEYFKDKRVVLDKSGIEGNGLDKNWIFLPNVGREGHSYLFYIIQNYHNLPEGMVFTQGDPSDHVFTMKCFLYIVRNILIDLPDEYIPLSKKFNLVLDGLDGFDVAMPIKKYWEELFVEKCPFLWRSFYAGIFYVSRNRVLRNPLSTYLYLFNKLNTENNPYYGYVLERMWTPLLCGSYTAKPLETENNCKDEKDDKE